MNRTRTSKNAKRLLVWLLMLTMVFSLLPMAAFADEAVVEEPVVSEEPVQDEQPSAEPTTSAEPSEEPTEPSEPTQEPEEPTDEPTDEEPTDEEPVDEEEDDNKVVLEDRWLYPESTGIAEYANLGFMKIMFLDCGRKYFSVDSIKQIIDNADAAGFNYIQLAVGNDGLRLLLDDMSLTVNGTTYSSDAVKSGIRTGNTNYTTGSTGELTQAEMDTIIAYAKERGLGVIPCVNTPGHMDAILAAATSLTGTNCSYNGSARTIDVTNSTAVAFTQALLQKYITYFAGKGCNLFNMGADEYANDKYTSGSMGFGNLQSTGKYSYYVQYVNQVADLIKAANMVPMAFNDGIYFQSNTSSGTFYTDIVICYWSNGWTSYTPMPAADLRAKGFKLINTHGSYYWVLGKSDWQCDATKARGFEYKEFQGGTIADPSGAMFCIWCDYPDAGSEATVINSTAATIAAFGKAINNAETSNPVVTPDNPTPTTPVESPEPSQSPDQTEVVEITVSVGDTIKLPAVEGDARKTFVESEDEAIAIASVAYTEKDGETITSRGDVIDVSNSASSTGVISDGNGHYLIIDSSGNITNTTEFSKATQFTITKNTDNTYYIKGGDYYLSVDRTWLISASKNAVKWTYTSSKGFVHDNYGYGLNYSNRWTVSSSGGNGKLYGIKSATTESTSETVLSITGVTVGDTTCKFDNKVYKIHVIDKAPDNALKGDLTLEYWITNVKVYDTAGTSNNVPTGNQTQTITSSDDGAESDEGIEIAKIAPSPAYSFFDGTVTVYYWQAMRLDAENEQTDASGDDETADGTTLTHVRYHANAWQYKTADGVWHYFESDDQLVAYYLQKTEVTKEVTSFVKDWGYGTDGTTPDTSNSKGQVALTVAAVYPDGTVSPAEGEMYANSTTIFNYWDGRDIGIVAPTNNSEYTISKITVTDGTRDSSSSANVWYTTDTITWEKTTNAAGSTWYDETEVWNESSGTTPMVNGKTSNIIWSAKNTAKLVLIYLKAVEKETNLTVKYINLSANNAVFHQYQVAMKYATGEETPTFTKKLMSGDGTVIGEKSPWDSNVKGDAEYLPDDAYVTNSSDKSQTFNKDITTIPDISGLYASGLYEYVKADITDDGKTLNLYYKLKPSTDKTYVVDFGLPIVIPFADFNVTNLDNSTKASFDEKTEELERTGNYGKGTIDMEKQTVTYSLFKMLDALTPIPVYFKDTNGNVLMRSVNVIPASNVYYEDSFVTTSNGVGKAAGATWTTDGEAQSANQTLSALGSSAIYGYDEAYEKNSTMFSMGSAKKVTVESSMVSEWDDTNDAWPTATFTFKGTGFDIISLTNKTSGAIFVDVIPNFSEGDTKYLLVDNYYGYKYDADSNTWKVDTESADTLYQIPVMKVAGLTYGEYTVTIRVAYSEYFDHTVENKYSFWLDAIRVYDPMGTDIEDYTKDKEGYPQYIKLRDKVADGKATTNNELLFIDGADKANVTLYTNYGPNNEVYLAKGQAISFKLKWTENIDTVQIGAKSPNATDGKVATSVVTGDIATATEMYYDITTAAKNGLVTITNNGDAILSLTNIKITYKAKDTTELEALTDSDAEEAVAVVRALFAAPVDPEPTPEPEAFDPKRFECEWSKNVRKGGRAILTVKASTDVDYIVVGDVTYDKFITRTERTGWGRNAQRVTYREFIYMMPVNEAGDIEILVSAGSNVLGVSEPVETTLSVKASSPIRDWIGGLFGRWF